MGRDLAASPKPKKLRPLRRGVVFYLDTAWLHRHPRVRRPQPPFRPVPDYEVRPFLCVSVDPKRHTSRWAPITSRPRPAELALRPEWLERRAGSFLQGRSRNWLWGVVYEGPNAAFTGAEVRPPGQRRRNRFTEAAARQLAKRLDAWLVRTITGGRFTSA